ncbi:vam6/Vps39-like protein [Sitodiplosis mosellana]|uniref:vam6/Vps39-like protein n=1 Tax=Sitodiplosis mosellana TaxID=263140 RepID=UPI0024451BEE|nr:vam6/Vps39-like protein [Sitodiplosis mosellana]
MTSEEKITHEAYTVCPPASIPVQIESLACYDNNVLLGTRQGHLLMYAVEQNATESKMDLQLLQYDKNFSKKPITQIDVIPEYQLLFSLTDGLVSIHDIARHNFPVVHSNSNTKGAMLFALNVNRTTALTGETALVVRLCVVIKRQLQFWYWKHDKLLQYREPIQLDDSPKAVVWLENAICIGFKTDYIVYDISSERPRKTELFPTSSSKTIDPCITVINELFAVVKDEFLIAVDPKSSVLQETCATSGKISKEQATLPQDQTNKSFKSFAWSHPISQLVWDEPYAIGLLPNGVEVRVLDASGSMKDTFIQTLPEIQKARHLVRSKKGCIFAASMTQLYCIQGIDIQKQCQSLLQQKKFQLALQLTEISDLEGKMIEKNRIQTRYAIDLFANKIFKESMREFIKLETDPCDVIRLFPNLFPKDSVATKLNQSALAKSNLPVLNGKDLEMALLALIEYLTEVRFNMLRKMQNTEKKTHSKNSNYLLSIIDTTLLKCYLQTNDSLVASVIRMNHCHLDETERSLLTFKKFGELIILYQTKGHHKKALQLLQSQAEIPSSSLFGHERTIQYLQHLGNEHRHLIFEFAGYVIEKSPEDGLRIFTEDVPEIENLHRAEVLDYLLKNHKSLVTPYLEHIIFVWNEKKALFHNILIQQYREAYADIKNSTNGGDIKQKEFASQNIRDKLVNFLNKYNYLHAETVLKNFPENDLFVERAIILGKLKRHEKVLAIYIQILNDVPKAIAYCEDVYESSDPDAAKNIFIQLIEILLKPPTMPPYTGVELHSSCLQPNVEAVLELLEHHAIKLNPFRVLQILPNDIPIVRLRPFLETALHHSLERRRNNQLLKGLLYASNIQLQEQRMNVEARSILVSEFSVCPACSKKFMNQSAFVRHPNGTIVHYSCRERNYPN